MRAFRIQRSDAGVIDPENTAYTETLLEAEDVIHTAIKAVINRSEFGVSFHLSIQDGEAYRLLAIRRG